MEVTVKINDKKIYDALVNFLKSLHFGVVTKNKDTDAEQWQNLSKENLANASFGQEPDYLQNMVKEPNAQYNMAARVINFDSEILGGTPVFFGTRVPIKNLFDYLETGESIEVFLEDFESVRKEQVVKVLELSKKIIENQQIA